MEQHVKTLAKKSAETHDSSDAVRWAQAASNVANALATLVANGLRAK